MAQLLSDNLITIYTIKGLTINNWQTDEPLAQMQLSEGTSIQEVINRADKAIKEHDQLKAYPVLSVNVLMEDNLGNPLSLKIDHTWSQQCY